MNRTKNIIHNLLPLTGTLILATTFGCDFPDLPGSGSDGDPTTEADTVDDTPDSAPEDAEGADNTKEENLLQVDRAQSCVLLQGDECSGYPGKGRIGQAPGEILPNFLTVDCQGKPYEFAQHFQLDDKGVPKYKSLLLFVGSGECLASLERVKRIAEFSREVEPLGMGVVTLDSLNMGLGVTSTPESCRGSWLKKLNSSPLGADHSVTVLADPTGNLMHALRLDQRGRAPMSIVVDYNGRVLNRDAHLSLDETRKLAQRVSDLFDDLSRNDADR